MFNISPKPRYKLYGGIKKYTGLCKDIMCRTVQSGESVKEFEEKIAQFCNVKFATCMPQNRVGVFAVIASLVQPGQGVIMTSYTISDMVNMVMLAGARPIFCDIDRVTCNMDPKALGNILDEEENIGAVIITHLHGLIFPIDEIVKKCKEKNVLIIEDAAQAFGARYNSKQAGTLGDVGVYSFGMFKNLSTWFGGAVVTDNSLIHEKVNKFIEQYPFQKIGFIFRKVKKGLLMDISTSNFIFQAVTFWIFRYGFLANVRWINRLVMTELDHSRKNEVPAEYLARMTPMQARIGIDQLGEIDKHSAQRIEYAQRYYEGLKDINQIILPNFTDNFSHIFTYFPIQYQNRTELLKYLMKNNRDIAAQHYKNCADLPWVSMYFSDCQNSRELAKELIFLPTYPDYGMIEVDKNIKYIRKYFNMK